MKTAGASRRPAISRPSQLHWSRPNAGWPGPLEKWKTTNCWTIKFIWNLWKRGDGRPFRKKEKLLLSSRISLTVEQSESLGLDAATSNELNLTIASLAGFLFSSIESLRLCVRSKLKATFLCSKKKSFIRQKKRGKQIGLSDLDGISARSGAYRLTEIVNRLISLFRCRLFSTVIENRKLLD